MKKFISNKQSKRDFKYFTFIVVIYCSVLCIADILVRRFTLIYGLEMSAASFLIPITYLIADIVVEIYGYQQVRKLIWYGIFSEFLFSLIGFLVNYLPIPPSWRGKFI